MTERFKVYEIQDDRGKIKWWVFDEVLSIFGIGWETKESAQFEADKLNSINNYTKENKNEKV